ncbi:hypothetical protein SARC_09080 [Sphaeroforma arctica JP610]|uniref:Cytochrome b5 heme-binding domain-containing protein n=1 Tax=Sphaeroforma arctica JP610 TaxID=667725 RepID=A0A0L0FNT5_9EUKA|nr:hypothetical protein SARC_09080 [Sphaeroforma arctica JP610]KNC78495.1 hypothetical protein SARC_09080 [Sphaeroforma arctica JP610]|eukprot:XP_014152397.1 hypothetical protein SARC_09080 [Sphaeroforma arctica JP610]
MTLEELRVNDGVQKPHIFIGLNGSIYDCSARPDFYGPKGPYGLFAGRDASRALATGDLSGDSLSTEHDDLATLTEDEKEAMREWEQTYSIKYRRVGALVREHVSAATTDSEGNIPTSSTKTTATVPDAHSAEAVNPDPTPTAEAEHQPVEQPSTVGNQTATATEDLELDPTILPPPPLPVVTDIDATNEPNPASQDVGDVVHTQAAEVDASSVSDDQKSANDADGDLNNETSARESHLLSRLRAESRSPTPSVGKDWEFVEKADAESKTL